MASLIPKKSSLMPSGKRGKPRILPKAQKDSLAIAQASNERNRERLARSGIADPTKKKGPSFLEKLGGVLDTVGTGTRSLVYNAMQHDPRKDVDVLAEMRKSFKGEKHLTGADMLKSVGVESELARAVGGFILDELLDPFTYGTLGFGSAAKVGGKALIGRLATGMSDDAIRALGVADDVIAALPRTENGLVGLSGAALKAVGISDDVVKRAGIADDAITTALDLGKRESQELMQGAFRAKGDRGGVKFAGISLGGQKAVSKAGYGAKSLARKIPGSKWAEQAFGAGHLADAYREGNEVLNAALTVARRDLSGKMALGDHLAAQFTKQLEASGLSEADRMKVTLAIGKQLKDPENAEVVKQALAAAGLEGDDLTNALELAETFQERMAQNLDAMRAANVDVADLTEGTGRGYLPGMTAADRGKRGNAAYAQAQQELGFDPSELIDPSQPKGRQWLNRLAPGANKSKTYLTPEDRLLGLTREGEQTQGLATELDLAKLGGKAERDAQGRIALAQYQDDLKNVLGGDKDFTELLSKTQEAFTNDEATQGFLRAYDKVLNAWKAMATSYNLPAFPARNYLSNHFLRWTEGLVDPTGAADREALRLVAKVMRGDVVEGADKALVDEMIRHRVFTNSDEIAEIIGGGSRSFIRDNPLGKLGGNVNTLVENQSRAASYIIAKNRGMKPEAASMLVDKALYNYDPAALTSFERNFVKRLVPFYTWMKRNTPHMAEVIATKPGKITPLIHAKDNAEATWPLPDKGAAMPDWMRDSYTIATPFKVNGQPLRVSTAGVIPVGDLEKLNLVRDGKLDFRDILGSVSPLIKTPLELIANKDIYYGDDISRYPGDTRRAPGYIERADDLITDHAKEMPEVAAAWEAVKDAFGIEYREDKTSGEQYVAMNALAVKAIRDMSPWLNNVGKLIADAPRTKADRISYFTGIRVIGYDQPRLERQQTFADQGELQDAMSRARDQGILAEPVKRQSSNQSTRKSTLIPKRR